MEQLSLPDPDRQDIGFFSKPERSGAPETQREAAISIYPTSGTKRRLVLDTIGWAGVNGACDWEIEIALHGLHQSISARRKELLDDGWIEDSGRRRMSPSRRQAVVWVLSPRGRVEWKPAAV